MDIDILLNQVVYSIIKLSHWIDFSKEILGYAKSSEELKELEKFYIKKFNAVKDDNFYNKQRLIFTFGAEFIRAGADSLILYYLFFQMVTPINKLGENGDQLVLGSFIIYTTYAIILFKIIMKRLNAVNYIHFVITILTIGALTGIAFIGKEDS